ncbi:MAG: Wzz/FepE/Etk N-terminal domain-containing protein [Candidatus Solibacter sp.]
MNESFDAYRYIGYLRGRWRWIAGSAALAACLAAIASLLMTPQYTATAQIVIDPPAGADLRSAMAVSPIYLESLKTYERFAGSDTLFQKAMLKFDLKARPIESVKRRVLNVNLVRNTRILEIAVTLPDPVKAQALAKFLADSTVEINRASVSESGDDLVRGIEQQAGELRARVQQADTAWAKTVAAEPLLGLEAAAGQTGELRAKIEEQARAVELEIADLQDRIKTTPDAAEMRRQESNARVRLAEMRKQMQDLERQGAEREKLLATRQAHRDQIDAERKANQTALAGMETRLRDARGETGFRGERLKVIDPGIVPERPSSPNLPLNVAAALLAGLVLPILFFTFEMNFQHRRAALARTNFRTVAKAGDE